MRLFILRHGQAESMRADDAQRALVPRGIAQVQRTADWLLTHQLQPHRIFASPYLRAQQTAETLRQHARWSMPIETENLLQPDSDPRLTASWIDTLGDNDVLLAAHMPLVSRLTENLSLQRCDFATAAIAVVIRGESGWKLDQFYIPGQ